MNIKDIIRKEIKKFDSLEKNKKIEYIFSLIFIFWIIITGILGLYVWGLLINIFSRSFFYEIINPLAFNLKTPWKYFLVFFFFITFFSGIYIVIKTILKKEVKIDYYLLFGIYIFIFLLIFGISFIKQSYGSEFTNNLSWQSYSENDTRIFLNTASCSISPLNCNSLGHYNKFVIGDEIYCTFEVNENCSFILNSIDIEKKYFNNDTIEKQNIPTINSGGRIFFPLEDNLRYISINPQFIESNIKNNISFFYLYIYTRDRYTLDEYHQKEYEKTFLIITLISISLFSTIVAMNNLKQLLEKNRKD